MSVRYLLPIAISGVLHTGVVLSVATERWREGSAPHVPRQTEEDLVSLDFFETSPLPEPEPVTTSQTPPEPQERIAHRESTEPRRRPRGASVSSSSPETRSEPERPPSEPSVPADLSHLSPDAVARSMVETPVDQLAAPWNRPSAPSGRHASSVRDSEQMAEDRLARSLQQEASARPHISQRPPPELHPNRDGSYAYRGIQLNARIAPDGTVSFEARGVEGQGLGFSFDLNDVWMRRAGQDPHQAERAWFMHETEEMRGRLQARALAAELRQADRGLYTRLDAIWARPTSADERRRLIFAAWDDCAEDEIGNQGRAAIERFIRSRIPQSHPDAYPPGEIQRLNEGRQSVARFAPY